MEKKTPRFTENSKYDSQKDEPNDFAMMEEVLVRRFNHPEWPFPDLIIVDGGKGQVSSALKIIKALNLNIPIIGLAKREKTIVTSGFIRNSFTQILKCLTSFNEHKR